MSLWTLRADDLWTIATAICCNVACGLLGCFLVLRRMSLLGDAISHAVLPGLAAAFLITGSRAALPMLAGAMVVGVLTAACSAGLSRWGRVSEDAAMGVVFTSLFALGVVMITRAASHVDLDAGCVLYGLIEFVPLDRVTVAGADIPRATLVLAIVLLVNVTLILVFYKELRIVAFDPYLASTMGFSAALVHYGLMAAVAMTTVASFESVGSILVVAMLIAPGATAHLLTDRLDRMLVLAAGVATLAAVVGYLLALRFNTSVAGMMSVVAGVEFALAVMLAPRYGYISKLVHNLALSLRVEREDLLGLLYRRAEGDVAAGMAAGELHRGHVPRWRTRWVTSRLLRDGLFDRGEGGQLTLTAAGQREARRIIRSHRLWERFLADHTDLPLDHLHAPAERMEHYLTPEMRAELANQDAHPDPHGRRIPDDA